MYTAISELDDEGIQLGKKKRKEQSKFSVAEAHSNRKIHSVSMLCAWTFLPVVAAGGMSGAVKTDETTWLDLHWAVKPPP